MMCTKDIISYLLSESLPKIGEVASDPIRGQCRGFCVIVFVICVCFLMILIFGLFWQNSELHRFCSCSINTQTSSH